MVVPAADEAAEEATGEAAEEAMGEAAPEPAGETGEMTVQPHEMEPAGAPAPAAAEEGEDEP
jgi:hypothetical protein